MFDTSYMELTTTRYSKLTTETNIMEGNATNVQFEAHLRTTFFKGGAMHSS
jgi:hypothetical protein